MSNPVPFRVLRRPVRGRWVGGVALGLSQYFGIRVKLVRWGFVISGLLGAGALFYLWLWVMTPGGEPAGSPGAAPPPALARLAPMLRDPVRRVPLLRLLGGVVLLVVAGLMAAAAAGVAVPWQWLAPTAALAGGVWLAWSQLERTDALARRGPVSWARLVGALALVVLAVVLLTTQGRDAASMLLALLAGVAVLAGVALVLAPWWLRLLNALGDQRAATARESERADIAAHLHDSVLQTLAVIRVQAEDPAAVRRLARAQERELRQWLYQDRPPAGSSLAAELKTTAAEVEDLTGVEIEMVLVGDRSPTAALEALVGATREALLNAGRHGRPPVSLYGELSERSVEVFVRDRGEGFDLDAVPTDRLGVRESILGRVRRQGGNASIRTSPGAGTEIRLQMDIGVMGSE